VALYGSGARAEESCQRQAREGVEADIEVDAEVHGTPVELVVVSTGPENGWRRPASMMRSQGRNKMTSGSAWSSLSGGLDAEKSNEVDQASSVRPQRGCSGTPAWWSDVSAVATASRARHAAEQRRAKWGLASPFDVKATDKGEQGAQGGNRRWAGCPGGLGPDYSGLGWYCRTGLGPRPN
jgi:hypothetical protein